MRKTISTFLLLIPLASLAACGGKTSALEVSDPQQPQITLRYYPPSNDPIDPQQTTTFIVIVSR